MKLENIKKLDKAIIGNEMFDILNYDENVISIESVGYSGTKNGYLWYDVTLVDNTHIDVYAR
jgi:hypothetical protein